MARLPNSLTDKLAARRSANTLRSLTAAQALMDFSSNDYLGLARRQDLYEAASELLQESDMLQNGSTGSRLLTGHNRLFDLAESEIAKFHSAESALLFNSGYDANLGFFEAVPQREDVVFYDEYVHASIRDGIRLGKYRSLKFRHNDLDDLRRLIVNYLESEQFRTGSSLFAVTESVFSMDGDSPDLESLVQLTEELNCHLVVDEAHALGVFGPQGSGRIQESGLQDRVFARITTFGKALGCHGAAVLGSVQLRDYLLNFARSLIYSTALSPHSLAALTTAHRLLNSEAGQIQRGKFFGPGLHLRSDIIGFLVANLSPDAMAVDQFLQREDSPLSVLAGDQPLGNAQQ